MSSPARRGASHEVVSTPLRVEARISESSDTLVPSSGELLTPNATLTSPSNGRSTPVSRCESSASSSRARTNQAHAMTNIRGMFNRRQLQPDNLLTANGQIAQVTWTQIGPGPPKQSRVCTLIQLIQRVKTKELEVSTLEGIFHESFDLLDDASLRDSTIMAFIELTRSQYGQIGIALRLNIFLRIRSIGCSFLAVEWLSVLTNDGTKIEGFEREMDFVLAEWMPKALSDQAEDISYMVLKMIQNLLLSYPHYVGPKQLAVFVSCAWRYSIYNADDRTYQCVMVLKAAAQHRHFPSKDLPATVYTMCALTQVSLADEEFAADPNKTLKIRALQVIHFLLRSSKYFTVRSLLTEILLSDAKCDTESLGEKPADTLTVNAMRGAVAAIGHAYWGAFPDAIDFPESLIPAFKRAIKYDVYACKSVLDSLALLFERSGVELLETTWHRVVSILHFVLKQCNKIEVYKEVCGPALQQLIDLVEQLFLEQRLLCPPDFLYDMIETFSSMRSDASVMRLMDFKASLISVHDDGWPSAIHKLLGRYFRAPGQNRTRREHALNLALAFFTRNRILRQRELLTRLVTPLFSHIEREKDQVIQLKLISSLFAVAEQVSAEGCEEGLTSVLRIIRRLFNEGLLGVDSMRERRDSRTSTPRPIFSFEGPSSSPAKPSLDNCDALLLVAQQLSELTVKRWQELNASFLSEIAITFVEHLQKQYQYSLLNEEGSEARIEALKTILSLQSHPIVHRLRRYCEDTKAYILLPNVLREGARVIGSSGTGETFGFRFICEVTSRALRTENSWAVMRTLLIGVRRVLECPDFVLTAPPDSVDELLLAILSIYERTVRTNMTKSTVEITRYLSPLLVSTLSYGLHDSRKADVCRILLELLRLQADTPEAYHAILTAVQAVPESMAKHAHSLISFIASTSLNPERSILVLELLSDAATVPTFFQLFGAKDFCAIGDIVTPLLDLTRYTMYIVAHAHRVILRWFSKIPVHFREEFSCHILEKLESLKFYSAAEATPECDIIRNNSSLLNSDRSSSLSNASLCSTIEDEALQKHLAFELRTSFLQFFGIGLALRSPTIDPVALDGYKCVSSVHYVVGDSVITLSTLRKSDDSSCDTSMKSKESAGSLHDAKTSSASTHSQFEQRRRHASAVQSSVRLSSSKAPVRMASVVEELPIEKRRHKSGAGTPTEHADEFEAPGPQLVVTQMLVRHMYGRSSWIMRDVEAMHDDAFPAMIGPTSYSSLAMHMASLPSTARLGYKKTSDHVNMRIRTLDRIAAVENMAVGVLYKTVGQTTDQEMLRNVFGGHRYESFLRHLGVPYSNEEGLAGLQVDKNGEYTYVFKDEMSCIVWLVGTLMPNKDDDALCNNKRRFIGNNVVCVLWNESLTPYKVGDFCHQFIYVMIELIPNRAETIEIRVHTKPEVSEFLGAKHFFVAEAAAPTVIKNLAMRAKLAVEVYRTVADLPRGAVPYISLPVERLRKIRSLREL